jgi:protein N-terminal amidase
MRIACLQFAPQVGRVSDNMARADAILSTANPDDLDGLDLLVLPEMAFSGMTGPVAGSHLTLAG